MPSFFTFFETVSLSSTMMRLPSVVLRNGWLKSALREWGFVAPMTGRADSLPPVSVRPCSVGAQLSCPGPRPESSFLQPEFALSLSDSSASIALCRHRPIQSSKLLCVQRDPYMLNRRHLLAPDQARFRQWCNIDGLASSLVAAYSRQISRSPHDSESHGIVGRAVGMLLQLSIYFIRR